MFYFNLLRFAGAVSLFDVSATWIVAEEAKPALLFERHGATGGTGYSTKPTAPKL